MLLNKIEGSSCTGYRLAAIQREQTIDFTVVPRDECSNEFKTKRKNVCAASLLLSPVTLNYILFSYVTNFWVIFKYFLYYSIISVVKSLKIKRNSWTWCSMMFVVIIMTYNYGCPEKLTCSENRQQVLISSVFFRTLLSTYLSPERQREYSTGW